MQFQSQALGNRNHILPTEDLTSVTGIVFTNIQIIRLSQDLNTIVWWIINVATDLKLIYLKTQKVPIMWLMTHSVIMIHRIVKKVVSIPLHRVYGQGVGL